MAIQTVTTQEVPAEPLVSVAHTQSGELWDVIALIEAARMMPFDNPGESGDRLLRLAAEKLHAVQHAFNPYI